MKNKIFAMVSLVLQLINCVLFSLLFFITNQNHAFFVICFFLLHQDKLVEERQKKLGREREELEKRMISQINIY